ncbi:MAG: hypothetical protein QOK62_06630 [Nitrososphaeraceae archaeon]|nr:hypothetical protein [Nitrososphaeraceae archaeon]
MEFEAITITAWYSPRVIGSSPTVTSRSILCGMTSWEALISSISRTFKEALVSGTVSSGSGIGCGTLS